MRRNGRRRANHHHPNTVPSVLVRYGIIPGTVPVRVQTRTGTSTGWNLVPYYRPGRYHQVQVLIPGTGIVVPQSSGDDDGGGGAYLFQKKTFTNRKVCTCCSKVNLVFCSFFHLKFMIVSLSLRKKGHCFCWIKALFIIQSPAVVVVVALPSLS